MSSVPSPISVVGIVPVLEINLAVVVNVVVPAEKVLFFFEVIGFVLAEVLLVVTECPIKSADHADGTARGSFSTTLTPGAGSAPMATSCPAYAPNPCCVPKHTPNIEVDGYGEALLPGVSRIVSLVITGIGNTAGAVMVTGIGGFGVSPRTEAVVPPGTVIKHVEGPSVAKHCEARFDGITSGGFPHHTEKGSGKNRKRSVTSPVTPGTSVGTTGTGMTI